MYNIIIFDSAYDDMDNIFNFCCNVSIKYTLKVRIRIAEAINSLRYFPFVNPLYFKIDNHIFRKKIVDKRYLIIFSVFQSSVIIYNIVDGRGNVKPTDLFK